tara:strand:- start:882 stop:2255 length:1374 start_codon:yes stop_codon:yes gene_type:complete
MERVLPKTLNYQDVLPLAVESRARRRTFFPINGQSFTATGANIIRIDLSADALLDTQHSYLRFQFTNDAAKTCGFDYAGGHAFIRRLRIEQSGVVLEDINSYNRLMGTVVLPCQSSDEHHQERAVTEGIDAGRGGNTLATNGATIANLNGITAMRALGFANASAGQVAAGGVMNVCIPLNSGILNNEKLIPLMLMSAPLTIEIELAPLSQPVCFEDAAATNYTISNVRYIANLIEVGQDVSGQLRMLQEVSGGVLTLAGQTYRHFTGAITATTGDQIINVPARVKSMKSLFFASQRAGGDIQNGYCVGTSGNMKLNEYQLKIGSVVYPPTPVRVGFGAGAVADVAPNRAEPLYELSKAWGSVGSTKGMGQLSAQTYGVAEDGTQGSSEVLSLTPFGLDMEAFQRVAIESGVNTADRSLPISLILNYANAPTATNVDVFVLADALFYLNADGSMSVSV